jgi:hypothetical protein
MKDLPSNVIDIGTRRKISEATQTLKDCDTDIRMTHFEATVRSIFPEVSDRTWAQWMPSLYETFKILRTGFDQVHERTEFDPRFAIILSMLFADVAIDEIAKVGICGAVDRRKFDEAVYTIVKDFKGIDYLEGELP